MESYIVACMNVWDDDFNLKLAISSIMDQVDEFIFLLGPYKYYPLFKDQNIYDINQETREMIYKLMGKKRFVIDNNMSHLGQAEGSFSSADFDVAFMESDLVINFLRTGFKIEWVNFT